MINQNTPVPDKCADQGHAWVTPSTGASTGVKRCSRCGERA